MSTLYNPEAAKRPTNLSLNSDLVQKVKEQNINLSSFLESALAEELRRLKEASWKVETREAVDFLITGL